MSKEYKEQQLLEMRLDNSMGTQTEALSKPSYKEIAKQPFLARITAQLEKNDHYNYCSDEDCEYTRTVVKTKIIVPEKYVDHPVGKIEKTGEYKWANHLPVPEVNAQGSGFCQFHKPKGGVGQHEYRYTIKKVEIVENKKTNKQKEEPKKTNKHGYVVMASEGSYSDYENVPYGFSETKEGAQKIANEAVCYGKKRVFNKDDCKGPFCEARIHDLDNMKIVGKDNMLGVERAYYREKSNPDRSYWDKDKRKNVYYTKEEIAENLKKMYDKMMEAKKRNSETLEKEKEEEKEKEKEKEKDESNPKLKYTKEERKKHWEEKHPGKIAKEKNKKEPEPEEETMKKNWFNNNQKKVCEILCKDE
jgi:hypothetical protein